MRNFWPGIFDRAVFDVPERLADHLGRRWKRARRKAEDGAMNIKQVTSIYFSPTGNTKTAAELIAGQIAGQQAQLDLTDPGRRPDYHFLENEAVLVGVPVYGGRIPAVAAERLKRLHGRKTAAILMVTYGNRAYEDALLELKLILQRQGFRPVAAAAVPAEHNIVRSIAQGRPDKADRKKLKQFGREVGRRFWELESNYRIGDLKVPGNRPFRKFHGVPLKIKARPSCKGCGQCIRKCPVQAISRTDPKVTDSDRCIACMRCVRQCPSEARRINAVVLLAVKQKLKKVCAERKEAEFFMV